MEDFKTWLRNNLSSALVNPKIALSKPAFAGAFVATITALHVRLLNRAFSFLCALMICLIAYLISLPFSSI